MIFFDFRFIGEAVKGKDEDGEEAPTGLSLVAATLKHMKKHYQQLLIPLTIWSGLEQGFFGADFTAVRSLKLFFLRKVREREAETERQTDRNRWEETER
jgi:hypothetical protein